jgi:hypothetical protein
MQTQYDKQKNNHLKYFDAFLEANKLVDYYSRIPNEMGGRGVDQKPQLSEISKKNIIKYNQNVFKKYPFNELFDIIIKKNKEENLIYNEIIDILTKEKFDILNIDDFISYIQCKELFDFTAILSMIVDEKERKSYINFNSLQSYYNNPNYAKCFTYSRNGERLNKNQQQEINKSEILKKDLKEYFNSETFEFKGNFLNQNYNEVIYNLLEKIFDKKIEKNYLPKDTFTKMQKDIEDINKKNNTEKLYFKDLSNKAIKSKVKAVKLR